MNTDRLGLFICRETISFEKHAQYMYTVLWKNAEFLHVIACYTYSFKLLT